jgi:lactate 2-monooxygenase
MAHFGDYQNEIYFAGLSGRQPRFPMSFNELEAKAHATLPKSVVSYVAGGCGNERTQDANVVRSLGSDAPYVCRRCAARHVD